MTIHRTFFSLLALAVTLILAACNANPTDSTQEPDAAPQGALPREHEVSAADLEVGEGTDICANFPQPTVEPFAPLAGSALNILPDERMLGPDDAPLTYIAYVDMSDPRSAAMMRSLLALAEEYADEVRVVFRQFAAAEHGQIAGQALESAFAQDGMDGYLSLASVLTDHQDQWMDADPADLVELMSQYAEAANLDPDRTGDDIEAETYRATVEFSTSSASQLGATAAPILYANDLPLGNPPVTLDDLELFTQVMLLRAQYAEKPPQVIDSSKDYAAWIVTEKGTIAADLFADLAPETVNNFAYLACTGYYDGVTFHRVLPGFVAQAGDPTGTGVGGPGYTINDEYQGIGLRFDREGWLSMAHTSQPNSAGSQFFITLGPAEHLDGAFTIFGEVVEGMDVAQGITPRDPEQAGPLEPGDEIETILVREVP